MPTKQAKAEFGRQAKPPVKVAVVPFHGSVANAQDAESPFFISYDTHREAIEKAFAWKQGKAVVLDIDCRGGSPSETYMLVREIRRHAEFHQKPVYAFVRRVATSCGYWLACAADDIYALPVSDVGSIGVVMAMFDYTEKNKKAGVKRRLFYSGEGKIELDEHMPLRKSDIEAIQKKLAKAHQHFIDDVRSLRKGRIQGSDKKVMNGRSWLAEDAMERGLIDGVGDMMDVMPELMKRPVRLLVFPPESKDISPTGSNPNMPAGVRKGRNLALEM